VGCDVLQLACVCLSAHISQ